MAYQVSTGRFVGRTQELARLSQLLAHAADGTPLVAVIGGEAGVGKTWLAERLAAIASGQSVRVLCGGYVPLDEDGLPFVPVTEHCAAWPTSWTRRSWMGSRVRPGRSWAGCCPTWPGAARRPRVLRWRVPGRGGCSSGCSGWSSSWPPPRRCC
jgi:hypothetical protein